MNSIIALCLLAVAVSALPKSEDQLILRLDEKIVSDGAATQDIINHLKYKYGYELIKEQPVGKLRFLGLRGDARYMSAVETLVGVKYIQLDNPRQIIQVCEEQPSPGTWGLDRIDQVEALPYTDPVSDDATYIYGGEATGSDSVVYIVDTGIDFVNPEFDGRASWGYTAEGMSDEDRHGHGTHCAGTVGAVNYGVAKDVTLVAVKVVNAFGAGTSLDFAGGIEWLISDHQAREASSGVVPKSVASMSLAYGTDEVVDNAAQEGADAGVIMVAAAGNNDHDACIESPSRVADVISVGNYHTLLFIFRFFWFIFLFTNLLIFILICRRF